MSETLVYCREGPLYDIRDWPSFLALVRERPLLWFREPSLAGLENVLNGIAGAEILYRIPEDKRLPGFSFNHFDMWVRRACNPERLCGVNSFTLARRQSECDSAAFTLWFEWYDRYLAERDGTTPPARIPG